MRNESAERMQEVKELIAFYEARGANWLIAAEYTLGLRSGEFRTERTPDARLHHDSKTESEGSMSKTKVMASRCETCGSDDKEIKKCGGGLKDECPNGHNDCPDQFHSISEYGGEAPSIENKGLGSGLVAG